MPFTGKKENENKKKKGGSSIPKTIAILSEEGLCKSYHIGNLQGIGSRKRQEDSFAFANAFDVKEIKKNGLLFVVCDGMGGMKDGKVASETAISVIRNTFLGMDREGDIAGQLKDSIYTASLAVQERLEGEGGSTVIAGIIYQDNLYYACVGDSFFYLKRGEQLYHLNRKHTVCNERHLANIRSGSTDPRDGLEDPESTALSQFLGMTGMNAVDGSVRPLPIKAGDVLLACSDGVGGVLEEWEVLDALSDGDDPQKMCKRLEQGIIARQMPHQDNYTALVVKCLI